MTRPSYYKAVNLIASYPGKTTESSDVYEVLTDFTANLFNRPLDDVLWDVKRAKSENESNPTSEE